MYFKTLELIGFKSFAEKTKLHFEPGVTAVVGPNGCGKSNISDSIKWAFGEQAPRSLRASRMEDVIFNGTEQAEPINFAEVSVTLSNERKILPIEYDEVTVTRRLHRSGESEYLLNKMPVRLKDIHELFMGTGIGTESYSMIEQGQIDLILSSKPDERRYIFEEASGITKYKSKKREALNKLEQTENNLLRINDIISEVKRQIASIERQAKKAERYKEEFEKLKDLDTRHSFYNFKKLKSEEKISSVEIEDIRGKERDVIGRIAHFDEIVEKLKADLDSISEQFFALQSDLMEKTSSVDKNTHTISVNKERIGELTQQGILLDEEIKRSGERFTAFTESLKVFKQTVENFTSEKQAKEDLVKQKEAAYEALSKEIEGHQKDIAESKSRTVENLARQSKFNNESARLAADIQNRSTRLRRLQIEIDKVKEELSASESGFGKIDDEAKNSVAAVSRLNEEKTSCQKELDQSKAGLAGLKEQLSFTQKEISISQSRLQFLEELIGNYEGFDKGARHILEAKKNGMFPGVEGPLCNIIDIEEGIETAFELVLGENLQSFVVKTIEEARELLSYLEANNLGVASVIIADDLPTAAPSGPIAGLRPLREALKAEGEHKKVLDYLLKDCFVSEDKEKDAFDMLRGLPETARIATADGKLLQRGRLCGGTAKRSNDASLLGREKKIDQVRFKIEAFTGKAEELNEAIAGGQGALEAAEQKIKAVERELRAEEINLGNVVVRKNTAQERLNRLNDENLILANEIEELKELMQELVKRQDNAKAELKEIEDRQQAIEDLITGSQDSIGKKSKQKEDLLVELTQYKTELSSLSREEKNRLENLAREENAFAELSSGIERKKTQLADGSGRIKELEEENSSLESQNAEDSSGQEKMRREIEDIRSKKAHLTGEIAKENQKIQAEKLALDQLREDAHKIEIKRNEFSYKQNSLRQRVQQAYRVDLDQAQLPVENGLDWEEIRLEIEELKARLERMGTVNLVAIEEHQELQERFNFLTHQQQDLIGAKESLMKAIQKINKTTKALFLETFARIQEEFRNFFRLLFGGGQAELLLMDDVDILESGIEIIVRPPGKKLQNISLLSGGEKSLTAIALLFAIFKVKPSPFCVLDEIDAALDESNIGRFSNVLKDFIKASQFIIITHNKKTIALADVMYGITMEKSGISKIVSVKFADAEKEKQKEQILA